MAAVLDGKAGDPASRLEASYWGRKLRVKVTDGSDGEKLAEFVLGRWPNVRRIQLRCD